MGKYATLELKKPKPTNRIDVLDCILFDQDSIANE